MDRRTVLKLALCAAALPTVVNMLPRTTPKESMLKLGKGPASGHRVPLKFKTYLDGAELPAVPQTFGHYQLVSSWGVLGNNDVSDCTVAGAAHEHLLWAAEAGKAIAFTDQGVIQTYGAITGYTPINPATQQPYPPDDNPTDQGATMADILKYRQQTGIPDAMGTVHKITAYAEIANSIQDLALATYLFSATGVGFQLPASAVEQFHAGQPWDVPVGGSEPLGGHYVCVVGRQDGYFVGITWGMPVLITPRFVTEFCDEAYAIFCGDMLTANKSIDGFNSQQLQDDVKQLAA